MLHCGKQMIRGFFKIEKRGIPSKGSSLVYPVSTFYDGDEMLCEVPVDTTLGYYCSECGMLIGVFPVDILPKKVCPECGAEIDVDYPRCPFCGHIYEAI